MFETAETLLTPAHGVLSLVDVARVENFIFEFPAVFANVKGIYVPETPNGIM
jgi:hypothetical protein